MRVINIEPRQGISTASSHLDPSGSYRGLTGQKMRTSLCVIFCFLLCFDVCLLKMFPNSELFLKATVPDLVCFWNEGLLDFPVFSQWRPGCGWCLDTVFWNHEPSWSFRKPDARMFCRYRIEALEEQCLKPLTTWLLYSNIDNICNLFPKCLKQ